MNQRCPTCGRLHFARPVLTHGLTPREWEIAGLVYAGLSNKEIADKLGVRLKTIKFHIGNVHKRWSLTSRPQVIFKMIELKKLDTSTKDGNA